MEYLICPRCGARMVQAAGLDGVWQCTQYPSHEFSEDPEEMSPEGAQEQRGSVPPAHRRRGGAGEEIPMPKPRCPRCRALLKSDDLGLYCDSPDHNGVYRPPKDDEPYWLAHLGITAPLPGVPQSSTPIDGTMCQPLGPSKKGGGGASGRRKRKKPQKKPIPWYQRY